MFEKYVLTVGEIREFTKDLPGDTPFGFVDYFGGFTPHDERLWREKFEGKPAVAISYMDLPSPETLTPPD